jgi:hypothetical protein
LVQSRLARLGFQSSQDDLERSPLYGGGGLCHKRAWDYGIMLLPTPAPVEETGRLYSSAGGVLLSP